MYLLADLRTHSFDLMQAHDCQSLSVRVVGQGDLTDLEQTLAGCGTVEDDHVWLDVELVRRLALFSTPQGWDTDFAAMVEFAREKGWLDPAGQRIRAHIEWPGAD